MNHKILSINTCQIIIAYVYIIYIYIYLNHIIVDDDGEVISLCLSLISPNEKKKNENEKKHPVTMFGNGQ